MAKEAASHEKVLQARVSGAHPYLPVSSDYRADCAKLQRGQEPREVGGILLPLVHGAVSGHAHHERADRHGDNCLAGHGRRDDSGNARRHRHPRHEEAAAVVHDDADEPAQHHARHRDRHQPDAAVPLHEGRPRLCDDAAGAHHVRYALRHPIGAAEAQTNEPTHLRSGA